MSTSLIITKKDAAHLKTVNSGIQLAVDTTRKLDKAAGNVQGALRALCEDKTLAEVVELLSTLPAVQELQKSAPKKPAKDAAPELLEAYAEAAGFRKRLDNVVRGLLRGLDLPNYVLSWSKGQIAVTARLVDDSDKADEPESGVPTEAAPVATPAEMGAGSEPQGNELVDQIKATLQEGANEHDAKAPAAGGHTDTLPSLESEPQHVQIAAKMPLKEFQAFILAVNEHRITLGMHGQARFIQ